MTSADIYNLIFYGLVAGVVGARLAYAARYLTVYLAYPISLLALTPATLSPAAGLITGLAVTALVGWRKRLPLHPTLDALAPGLAAFLVTLGVAHFLSGDAFGAPTTLPWAIDLWDDARHPSQAYETLAALAVFAVAWKRPVGVGQGLNFSLVVGVTGAARVFREAFRGDTLAWAGSFWVAQAVGVIVLGTTLCLMRRWMPLAARPEGAP